jgi:hypothetical protein
MKRIYTTKSVLGMKRVVNLQERKMNSRIRYNAEICIMFAIGTVNVYYNLKSNLWNKQLLHKQ